MKIVVGFDGSEHSRRALQRATELAGADGQLVVVASAEARLGAPVTEGGRLDPSTTEHAHRALSEARDRVSGKGLNAEFVETFGDPGAAIIEAAEGADLVVVGSRGISRLERVLLGSVSTKVVQRASCDVLVVR